jgi:hypothetical protein
MKTNPSPKKTYSSRDESINEAIKIISKVKGQRAKVKKQLAQRLGRTPTFIEITEELRRRQGDKRAKSASNIISASLTDAYLALKIKRLTLTKEKIIQAVQALVLGIETKALPEKDIENLAKQFFPILKFQINEKILSQDILQLVNACFELSSLSEKDGEVARQIKKIKKILNKLS